MNNEEKVTCGALHGLTLVTMDETRRIIKNAGILWEDDRIKMIGSSTEIIKFAEERNIESQDCSGKIAFPGLVNTHTHLYQNLLKGLGTDTALESWWHKVIAPAGIHLKHSHLAAAVAGGAIEAVRSGVTTIVDYMQVHPIPNLSDSEITVMRDIGVRLVYGRGFRTTGRDSGFPAELIEQTQNVFSDVLRLKERFEKPDQMTNIWLAPAGAWALSLESLQETSEFSRQYDIPVMMHMYETDTDEIVCRKKYNTSALDYFINSGLLTNRLLAVHCVKTGEEEFKMFQKYGVQVSHNPVSNMYLASGVAPVPKMHQAGLTVSLGTDGAASNNCNDLLEVIKTTALLQKVHLIDPLAMTAQRVLEMATIDAAKCIGMEKEIGSLEVGKKADFFIVNPYRCARMCPVHDPVASLVYSGGNRAVEKVMINGRVVLNNGNFVKVDEEKVLVDEQQKANELVVQAGYFS
ncbi:amidohydrolase family protein [Sporomusa sp. KB1]|jgi:5-methylthioadenosine/S-adenosylhomocysteine deaminase|uniref:amidohydrolase family protein n=1 Tax=Sporomusa sp. KB1 TaxID=943346 RepID=UPI0011A519B5|nr:amidohydrolase [Sporomusa sp. KB1]TWH52062.1 5-methylthioadenosine/S-adenosylhomocysteine deaminase [Sporomusa sp. KB1]